MEILFDSRNIDLGNETVSILLNKTNYADIWGGYKIVKEKDCYVLYIAEKGETNE